MQRINLRSKSLLVLLVTVPFFNGRASNEFFPEMKEASQRQTVAEVLLPYDPMSVCSNTKQPQYRITIKPARKQKQKTVTHSFDAALTVKEPGNIDPFEGLNWEPVTITERPLISIK